MITCARSSRSRHYLGLLSVCRTMDTAWLKRADFSFSHASRGGWQPYNTRVMRLAVRSALREREAEVLARAS